MINVIDISLWLTHHKSNNRLTCDTLGQSAGVTPEWAGLRERTWRRWRPCSAIVFVSLRRSIYLLHDFACGENVTVAPLCPPCFPHENPLGHLFFSSVNTAALNTENNRTLIHVKAVKERIIQCSSSNLDLLYRTIGHYGTMTLLVEMSTMSRLAKMCICWNFCELLLRVQYIVRQKSKQITVFYEFMHKTHA